MAGSAKGEGRAVGIIILICLVVAAAAVLVVVDRRRGEESLNEREDSPAVSYINSFIGTLYMVLLALVVVVAWQNTSDVSGDVRTEAAGLQALVQTADRMPATEREPLIKAAHEYATSVLNTEWPPKAGTDVNTNAPAARILATARAAVSKPAVAGASAGTIEDVAISEINQVADARDDRLAKSGSSVPTMLLIALGALSLLTIATPLALGLRADPVAFTGLVITTALVILAFWFVLVLQSPYHGLIHASQQPLREVASGA
jgi:Protein of unknown function (DUF4239)